MSIIYSLSLRDKFALFFKGPTALFGIIFFLFGMLFLVIFGSASDFSVFRFWLSSKDITKGIIIESVGTNFSENDRNVTRYEYEYEIQGVKHYGKSYSSSKYLSMDEEVDIEYLSFNHKVSRIKGMKRRPFSFWPVLFISIFPGIGLMFLLYNISKTFNYIAILQHAAVTKGKLLNSSRTNTRINNNYVYKMEFEYTVYGRVYKNISRTIRPEILEDDIEESVIYFVKNPQKSIMYDMLPYSLQEKLAQKFPILKS